MIIRRVSRLCSSIFASKRVPTCSSNFHQSAQIRDGHRWVERLPTSMRCMTINNYADTLEDLEYDTIHPLYTVVREMKPEQALVRVLAASINPFDIEMTKGYGKNAINAFRKYEGVDEFPMVLGRDYSGVIVKRGKRFRRHEIGDEVWGVRWVVGQGTHAQYVVVNKSEVAFKPKKFNHVESASIPYVACTTWGALQGTDLLKSSEKPVRRNVFVPGGTGGVGSFAAQLLQAYGHRVVTSCAKDALPVVKRLGIETVLDYTSESFFQELAREGPFDVILDTLNERFKSDFVKLLRNNSSKYVSLRPTLLPDTDERGVVAGALQSGSKLLKESISQLYSGKGSYQWGFFQPNALILDNVKPLIEDGKIKPLIDRIYDIGDVYEAYKHCAGGHARGKTVLRMVFGRIGKV